jgi:hypothetical protein
MPSFQYLNQLGASSIRLLRIPASSDNDEKILELQIDEHQLASLPPFHALSYTWGPPAAASPGYFEADKSPIRINGHDFEVLPNLLDALLHLQASEACTQTSCCYWIDAICINQGDPKEREVQVGMMDKIYRSADRVDIWLGKMDKQATTAIPQLVLGIEGVSGDFWKNKCTGEELIDRYGLPPLSEDIWMSFIDFYERAWFNRTWIVQEVALASNAVVLLGAEPLRWQEVAWCDRILCVSGLSSTLRVLSGQRSPDGFMAPVGEIAQVIQMAQNFCHTKLGDVGSPPLDLEAIGLTGPENVTMGHFLLHMLMITRILKATDGRDKVYGVLGILNGIADINNLPRLQIKADYTQSTTATVFIEATKVIMKECNHLGMLSLVDEAFRTVHDLPSWVPDFTIEGGNPILQIKRAIRMDNSKDPKPKIFGPLDFNVTGGELHAHASLIGTVSHTSDPCVDMIRYGKIDECVKLLVPCKPMYHRTGQPLVEALWRTLLLDLDETHDTARPEFRQSFRDWITWERIANMTLDQELNHQKDKHDQDSFQNMDWVASNDYSGTFPSVKYIVRCLTRLGHVKDPSHNFDLEDGNACKRQLEQGKKLFEKAAGLSMPRRRVFRTNEDHIGLGTQSMMIGDSVWFVSGCPTPLVLRKGGGEGGLASQHKLVGEAYVHGIMNGEDISEETRREKIVLV